MVDHRRSEVAVRALSLLSDLSRAGVAGACLGDLASVAGLSKPTAHRLLASMIERGFAQRVPGTRLYRLGPAAASLTWAPAVCGGPELRWRQALLDMVRQTDDPAFMMVRSGDDAVCIESYYGPFPVRILTEGVGGRTPLGSGVGSIALLSSMPEGEATGIVHRNAPRLAAMGISCDDAFRRLRWAYRYGYAYEPGTLIPETSALAIYAQSSASGEPIAFSVATQRDRLGADRVNTVVKLLRQVAAQPMAGDAATAIMVKSSDSARDAAGGIGIWNGLRSARLA